MLCWNESCASCQMQQQRSATMRNRVNVAFPGPKKHIKQLEKEIAMPLRGVILDIDGTLVDSVDAHARAWHDALVEAGYMVPVEQLSRLIGMGGDQILPRVAQLEKDSPEGQQISSRRQEIFMQRYLPTIKPFPSATELLEYMYNSGLKLVVASSAQSAELELLLELAGAPPFIADRTSASDAEQSKPEPDIVAAALERMGYMPSETVMLGDTPFDVEAASRAGIACIALRCGGWNDNELDGAVAIYSDPADLLEKYAISPLTLWA